MSYADLNISQRVEQLISNFTDKNESEIREERRIKIENSIKKIEELQTKSSHEDINKTAMDREKLELRKEKDELRLRTLNLKRNTFLLKLEEVNRLLEDDNIWSKVYSNYETYNDLENKLLKTKKQILFLKNRYPLGSPDKAEEYKLTLKKYEDERATLRGKLAQLQEYKEDPFKKLLTYDEIGEVPVVRSPLDIIKAVSFSKQLNSVEEDYQRRYVSLTENVNRLHYKENLLIGLIDLNISTNSYEEKLKSVSTKLEKYDQTLEIFKTTQIALEQKVVELKLKISDEIGKEIEKAIIIGSIILFLLLVFFFIKYLVKKYMSENELYYTTNKALNFTFIMIIFFILLFSYLENVGHLVTILSFASAGIAIALKDWFMSMMGWLVIIFSGAIHVGDRIKVTKDGNEFVGDVVDISLLRMTLHEDVTLTTDMVNRRAGRIIFIPNNYVFTDIIANYAHSGLKTVWDGIDFVITFDSNVTKAQSISKEISRKYSKGYTDMTRKQLNKLRSKYSMRNTSVEPRIFAFLDENGVRISVWYLTNAYATLTLRSTISMEILQRIREADDISIAFPSQS
ncbi:MAG: mechanosensitive ion channel, partial [Sulfurovaceae bacterium]|nr:mechanosensitive ion channel [Sulfurovaceae bacterium]